MEDEKNKDEKHLMSRNKKLFRRTAATYFSVLLITILLSNVFYWFCVNPTSSLVSLFYVGLFEFFLIGIAFELAEIAVALTIDESVLPRVVDLTVCPRTALLYVTCDDHDYRLIEELYKQDYPNLDIYILDDSITDDLSLKVSDIPVTLVRRDTRNGYKAGNLNNWLFSYGSNYAYFVVADADSFFPTGFVREMVMFAEHHANKRVAVFESQITNWNTESKFANLLNLLMPLSHRIGLTLENRLGQTLSVGHNNLYRTDVLLAVGGFTTEYVAEDYATTLRILSSGLGICKTVPVKSFERTPANLHEYAKRQARWALQTFQLSSVNISRISWLLRFRILRTFYSYAASIVWFPALSFFCAICLQLVLSLNQPYPNTIQLPSITPFHIFWIAYCILPLIVGIGYASAVGVPPLSYLKSSLFAGCLFVTTIWPVFYTVICGLMTGTVTFERTGRRSKADWRAMIKISGPQWMLVFFAFALILFLPSYTRINFLWIILGLCAPVIAYFYQS